MIERSFRGAVLLFAVLSSGVSAIAHDGPPYPIFVDEPIRDWTVSIWTDPDVGTGTFFYYVEVPHGRALEDLVIRLTSESLDDVAISVTSWSVRAEPNEPFQLVGELDFAHRGTWRTTFTFVRRGPDGDERLGELTHPLEVTPPGLGTIDILWFALPFLAIGGLWLRALVAQMVHDRAALHDSTPLT